MKKLQKQVFALLLICVMAVSAVVAAPVSASAAKTKTTSKSLAVTNTKLSGIKDITGMTTLNNKYLIVYGKDSKGKNVYSYSTNGKIFKKAAKVGLSGDYVSFQTVGKNLYVVSSTYSYGSSGKSSLTYKYVTDPAKLAKASVKKVQVSLPKDYTPDYVDYNAYGYGNESSGKLYLYAYSRGNTKTGKYQTRLWSIVLNKTKVQKVDLYNVAKKALKSDDFDLDSYISYSYDYSASSSAAKGYFTATYTKDGVNKIALFYTTNGTSFKRLKDVPSAKDSRYTVQWMGKKIMAYRSEFTKNYKTNYTLEGKGTYYLYNLSKNKWDKKSIGKAGYSMNSYNPGGPSVNFYGINSIGTAVKTSKKSIQIMYTTNGNAWKTLKTFPVSQQKGYTAQNVMIEQADKNTWYAETVYSNGKYEKDGKSRYVFSRLKGGKWSTYKTKITTSRKKDVTGHYVERPFSSSTYSSPLTAIYNNGKNTIGYNITSGKSYTLPFTYNGYDQNIMGGSTIIYFDKSYLYGTKNAYKNITKITLKAGKKALKKKITDAYGGYLKNKSYLYFLIDGKMYYATYDKVMSSIK